MYNVYFNENKYKGFDLDNYTQTDASVNPTTHYLNTGSGITYTLPSTDFFLQLSIIDSTGNSEISVGTLTISSDITNSTKTRNTIYIKRYGTVLEYNYTNTDGNKIRGSSTESGNSLTMENCSVADICVWVPTTSLTGNVSNGSVCLETISWHGLPQRIDKGNYSADITYPLNDYYLGAGSNETFSLKMKTPKQADVSSLNDWVWYTDYGTSKTPSVETTGLNIQRYTPTFYKEKIPVGTKIKFKITSQAISQRNALIMTPYDNWRYGSNADYSIDITKDVSSYYLSTWYSGEGYSTIDCGREGVPLEVEFTIEIRKDGIINIRWNNYSYDIEYPVGEVTGFYVGSRKWGNRDTIINSLSWEYLPDYEELNIFNQSYWTFKNDSSQNTNISGSVQQGQYTNLGTGSFCILTGFPLETYRNGTLKFHMDGSDYRCGLAYLDYGHNLSPREYVTSDGYDANNYDFSSEGDDTVEYRFRKNKCYVYVNGKYIRSLDLLYMENHETCLFLTGMGNTKVDNIWYSPVVPKYPEYDVNETLIKSYGYCTKPFELNTDDISSYPYNSNSSYTSPSIGTDRTLDLGDDYYWLHMFGTDNGDDWIMYVETDVDIGSGWITMAISSYGSNYYSRIYSTSSVTRNEFLDKITGLSPTQKKTTLSTFYTNNNNQILIIKKKWDTLTFIYSTPTGEWVKYDTPYSYDITPRLYIRSLGTNSSKLRRYRFMVVDSGRTLVSNENKIRGFQTSKWTGSILSGMDGVERYVTGSGALNLGRNCENFDTLLPDGDWFVRIAFDLSQDTSVSSSNSTKASILYNNGTDGTTSFVILSDNSIRINEYEVIEGSQTIASVEYLTNPVVDGTTTTNCLNIRRQGNNIIFEYTDINGVDRTYSRTYSSITTNGGIYLRSYINYNFELNSFAKYSVRS